MLRKEGFAMIKALHERGVHQVDIAVRLGVHPKTVSRALKRGGAPKGSRPPRGSQLAPYQARVDELLAEDVWNAVVIWREIQTLLRQDGDWLPCVGGRQGHRANPAALLVRAPGLPEAFAAQDAAALGQQVA
jgi:hypothetical protein